MNERLKNRLSRFVNRKRDSHKLKKAERYAPDSAQGLSEEQVAARREDRLVNAVANKETKPYWKIVFHNLFNFCNTTCILLVILLLSIGAWDYTVSTSIIFVNIFIGIYQEVKAKRAVAKLTVVHRSDCEVIRAGARVSIPADEIVLDDVVVVNAGRQIPVDAIVLDGECETDESILTGESVPVRRRAGERVLAGSSVISGEALCRADRVGKDCYIEGIVRIAKKINKPKSNVFDTLNKIIKGMSVILLLLAVMLLISERVIADGPWRETIISVSSSILSMIPIGIFMLTSAALAVSVIRLSKSNALPQDIYSVEMLANVDTLLLDKTGTITDGQLDVCGVGYFSADERSFIDGMIRTVNERTHDNKNTAAAMLRYFAGAPLYEAQDCVGFSSARRYSAMTSDGVSYLLGAPDALTVPTEELDRFCSDNAADGKRTLFLVKFAGRIADFDKTEATPLAGIVLEDTLRPDVARTLDWFYRNGVDVKIVSGDNPATVQNISRKAGVRGYEKTVNCAELSAETLAEKAADTTVFGRVSPEQKCEIVHTLQAAGKTVGMVGDGVNDVQALKESDCSISFGQANEVARNISRIVLLDNNFSALPAIVREGRKVINNIEKVSALYLMKNFFIMFMTLMFAIVTMVDRRASYPFDTKKMLLVEFFVIGVPSLLYAVQPNERRITGDFMRNVLISSIAAGVSMIAATCLMYGLLGSLNYGGIAPEALENYQPSLLTLTMTLAAFAALAAMSFPLNKLRAAVVIGSFALIWTAVYVDTLYIGGTFLGMEILLPAHFGWLVLTTAVAVAVNLLLRLLLRKSDEKYGAAIMCRLEDWGAKLRAPFRKKR